MKKFVLLPLLVLFFLCPNIVFAHNVPDRGNSAILETVSGRGRAPADGKSPAKITVLLKDSFGNALNNDSVSISISNDPSYSATPAVRVLNSEGVAEFEIVSTHVGVDVVDVLDVTQNVTLTGLGTVTFFDPNCDKLAPNLAPKMTGATSISSHEVKLTWVAPTGSFTHYMLSYGLSPSNYIYGSTNIGDSNALSYLVGGLSKGKKYYFAIRAVNDCISGPYSNELSQVSGVVNSMVPSTSPSLAMTVKATPSFVQEDTKQEMYTPYPKPTSEASLYLFNLKDTNPKIIFLIISGLALLLTPIFIVIKRK